MARHQQAMKCRDCEEFLEPGSRRTNGFGRPRRQHKRRQGKVLKFRLMSWQQSRCSIVPGSARVSMRSSESWNKRKRDTK